jgi:hypothetical protein
LLLLPRALLRVLLLGCLLLLTSMLCLGCGAAAAVAASSTRPACSCCCVQPDAFLCVGMQHLNFIETS